jgi:DNA-binding MarR family transcriptional regulator
MHPAGPATSEYHGEIYSNLPTRKSQMAKSRALVRSDFEALAEFRFELRRFLRFSDVAAKSVGLRPLQYQLLLQIKGYPQPLLPTVGELAARLQIAQHATVALVTRCEKAGFVQRVPGQVDRRRVCVKLTTAGQRAVRRVAMLHHNELQSVASVFRVARLSAFNDAR